MTRGGFKAPHRLWCGPFKEEPFLAGVPGDAERSSSRVLSVPNEGGGGAGESRAGLEGAGGAGEALSDPEPRALISLEMWLSSGVS